MAEEKALARQKHRQEQIDKENKFLDENPNIKKRRDEFLKKCYEKFGREKFDYSQIKYRRSREFIYITCNIHNINFYQDPWSHLRDYIECKKCKEDKKNKELLQKQKEFIKKSIKIHGDKFDYSKVRYIGVDEKVQIICLKHNGEFSQTPINNLAGNNGCTYCQDEKRQENADKKEKLLKNLSKMQ